MLTKFSADKWFTDCDKGFVDQKKLFAWNGSNDCQIGTFIVTQCQCKIEMYGVKLALMLHENWEKNCKKIAWNYMKVAINCVISKNVGYQSLYLSYAKRALYHLSYHTSWLSQKTAHTCRPAFTRIYEVGITFRILFRGLLQICNLQNVQRSAKIWPCLD